MGASILSGLVFAFGLLAQDGPTQADPADGPPPLLEERIDPDDAPSSTPQGPDAPIDEDQPAPNATPSANEPNEDWLMLGADYLILFIPVVGGALFAPLAQGLTHKLAGETLVENEYPNWWLGSLAGYGVFAVSTTAIVGGYVLAVFGSLSLQASPAGVGALLGGLAIMAAGAALVFVEPAVVYFVARTGARAVPGDRAKRISLAGEPDEDDETPEQPVGWLVGAGAWPHAPAQGR